MLTAWYKGNHKGDLLGMLGYWLIRLGQWRQAFGRVTHCEAILAGPWYSAVIAGASRRDGQQVRVKLTELDRANWIILDAPDIDQVMWETRFKPLIGVPYSDVGAVSSASPFWSMVLAPFVGPIKKLNQWCSRTLIQCAGFDGAEDLSVSEAITLVKALPRTVDVTNIFFSQERPVVIIATEHPFLPTKPQEKEGTQ